MNMLKLHNTLTRKKENFVPIDNDHVRVYACGPTVYGRIHVGNARPIVVFDVLVRLLRLRHAKVTYVRNITDVDDKINIRAAERGIGIDELCAETIETFHQDTERLGALAPDIEPRATHHIAEMQAMITTLIDKGHAYAADGHVLFQVSTMRDYGSLSKRSMDDMIAGARVEVAPYKREPADFILWKPSSDDQPGWDSPWGRGRPGWHIECSAMSNHFISNHFDIHGGGMDLTFPHHENEIAQSEGANNCKFVNTWMHVGFVNIDDEKMSKSLNNFFTIRNVLDKYDGETLRYFLISSHYRSPLNFSETNIESAKSALKRLYNATKGLSKKTDAALLETKYEDRFNAALNDDFNTPIALSILFEIAKQINIERATNLAKANALAKQLIKLGNFIGILEYNAEEYLKQGSELSEAEISNKILQRESARNSKDFAMSDQIRDELLALGIILEDSVNGTTWRRK